MGLLMQWPSRFGELPLVEGDFSFHMLATRWLHEKLGFVEVGRMPQVGRKFDRWLDALFVQRTF